MPERGPRGPRPPERRGTPKNILDLPETGPDRTRFDELTAIVDRLLDAAYKKHGEPANADAYRRRVTEAVEVALESKQMQGERRRLFYSWLTTEFGRRGGERTAAKLALENMAPSQTDAVLPPSSNDDELTEVLAQVRRDQDLEDALEHEYLHHPLPPDERDRDD